MEERIEKGIKELKKKLDEPLKSEDRSYYNLNGADFGGVYAIYWRNKRKVAYIGRTKKQTLKKRLNSGHLRGFMEKNMQG